MRADPIRVRVRNRLSAIVAALLATAIAPPDSGADSITLNWTAPGDDGSTGRAAVYDLRYSEAAVPSDTSGWWQQAISAGSLPPPLSSGGRESFTVSGLSPGKTYYFVIRTADEIPNWSAFSNVAMRQTGSPPAALETPSAFTARPVPGGVELSWITVLSGAGYRLYRGAAADSTPGLLATLPLAAGTWIDSNASPAQRYEYRLATYEDALESAPAVVQISVPSDLLLTSTGVRGYPNPARGPVTLRFSVGGAGSGEPTRVSVFDLVGHRICVLSESVLPPGEHAVVWDCRAPGGSRVTPGLYNVIVDAPSGRSVARLAILP